VRMVEEICIPSRRCGKSCQWVYETAETQSVLVDALRPTLRMRPEEGQVSISLSNIGPVRRDVRMTHSMGACPTYLTREMSSAKPALEKEWKITSAEYGNDEVQEDDGGSKQKRFCERN
jgi:hypothetical protein